MNDSDDIKALIPVVCPHCNKTSVVEFLITANLLDPKAAEEVLKSVEPAVPPATPVVEPEKNNESEEE